MFEPAPPGWTEADSAIFIDYGDAFSPARAPLARAFAELALTPDAGAAAGPIVELCCGTGWLGDALLRADPQAHAVLLDLSPAMLAAARATLGERAARADFRPFRLEAPWPLDDVLGRARAVVTSLAFHHLDGPQKRDAFHRVRALLAPGRPFVVLDLVAPPSPAGRAHAAAEWDRLVAERATPDQLREFEDDRWNYYRYPDDPTDKPSSIAEQLRWLGEAGFRDVDVSWMRAGHALFGGTA